MNDELQEQASAYALGILPESERAAFERELARSPDLQALVREFHDALGNAARSLPAVTPPPALKARLMAKVATGGPPSASPPPAREAGIISLSTWIPWAAAACLAVAAVWLFLDRSTLNRQISAHATTEDALQRTIAGMEEEAAALRAQGTERTREAAALRERAAALEETVMELRAEIATAQSAADLANMQVARLASLAADQPRASAVSLWNDSTQQGVLLVDNLPVPPPGKTYEVWVIDPDVGVPVSAGIFTTDAEGRGRIVFRPRTGVQKAGTIAVSIEGAGGSTSGKPDTVIMAGGATQL